MNEQELRAIVRAAVARHLGAATPANPPADARMSSGPAHHAHVHLPLLSSQTLYAGLVNVGDACVIEPATKCDHCGYCKSHGY